MINCHALRKVMKTTLLTQRIAQVFHLKLIVLCLIQKAGMNLYVVSYLYSTVLFNFN